MPGLQKKIRGKFLIILLVGLIFHTTLNIYAGKNLREEIKKIRKMEGAAGLKDFTSISIPDEQNAATIYQKVFSLYAENSDELNRVHYVKSYADTSEWTEEEKEEIPAILAKHDEIFELLHEASLKPDCIFNLDYSKGPKIPFQNLSGLRACVRLLYIKSTLEKEKGEMEKAVGRIFDGLAVARVCGNERTLINSLVRIACDSIMLDDIQKLLTDREISWQSCEKLYDALKEERETQVVDFRGERDFTIAYWYDSNLFRHPGLHRLQAKIRTYEIPGHSLSVKEKIKYWYLGTYFHRPFFKLGRVRWLRTMTEIIELSRKPYWEIKNEGLFSGRVKPRKYRIGKEITKSLQQEARLDAQLGTAELAVALRMYRSKNGSYPASLNDLLPDIVVVLPLDPFTGKDFVYRREGNGFTIYSLGENAKNDGGKWGEPSKWMGDYDIVWKFDE